MTEESVRILGGVLLGCVVGHAIVIAYFSWVDGYRRQAAVCFAVIAACILCLAMLVVTS